MRESTVRKKRTVSLGLLLLAGGSSRPSPFFCCLVDNHPNFAFSKFQKTKNEVTRLDYQCWKSPNTPFKIRFFTQLDQEPDETEPTLYEPIKNKLLN
jgi:hypothetical protein